MAGLLMWEVLLGAGLVWTGMLVGAWIRRNEYRRHHDDDGNAALNLILGVLGALSFLAFTALFLYSSYRHYSIPLHHGRGEDVWGTMAFISFWGAVLTGVFTLFMADE